VTGESSAATKTHGDDGPGHTRHECEGQTQTGLSGFPTQKGLLIRLNADVVFNYTETYLDDGMISP
jgi:hypothetical protein